LGSNVPCAVVRRYRTGRKACKVRMRLSRGFGVKRGEKTSKTCLARPPPYLGVRLTENVSDRLGGVGGNSQPPLGGDVRGKGRGGTRFDR